MQRVILLFVAIAATFLVLTMVPAHATFHGTNGRIAYSIDKGSGEQIYTIKPDGTHKKLIARFKFDFFTRDWGPRPT